MKALFIRKVWDLKELKRVTDQARINQGTEYVVSRVVYLTEEEYGSFTNDLLEDRDWIKPGDGGPVDRNTIKVIRVVNQKTNEALLVNPEGYNYPRYVAIE